MWYLFLWYHVELIILIYRSLSKVLVANPCYRHACFQGEKILQDPQPMLLLTSLLLILLLLLPAATSAATTTSITTTITAAAVTTNFLYTLEMLRMRAAVVQGRRLGLSVSRGAWNGTRSNSTIGFIGLGQMGARMAVNLVKKVWRHPGSYLNKKWRGCGRWKFGSLL